MALIYANAVNKRMNNGSRNKKRTMNTCPLHDENPDRDNRRSLSRDVPVRKHSENSYMSSSGSSCNSLSPAGKLDTKRRPVQRSKTSCGEFYLKKIVEDDAFRKTSHPAMSDSAHTPHLKQCDNKSALTKKSLIQKYDLEEKMKSDKEKMDRRRSVSLDQEHWKNKISDKKDDDGAFTKMKRKFSKLMFN